MTPAEARYILFEDANFQKSEFLSATEWEERVSSEPLLRAATDLVGTRIVSAISAMVWEWDRPFKKKSKR